ncbi:hypothetical protein [Streptomyces sp. NPDC048357]|uniref:hypothetical protein n=1 Tax=Streptomyces sp. NPDC048357 TaxID=3154719 RepID=UPI0034289E5E
MVVAVTEQKNGSGPHRSVGTVVTAANGEFRLSRPSHGVSESFSLDVEVQAADDGSGTPVVLATAATRPSAGPQEEYLLRIATHDLHKAGVPTAPPAVDRARPGAVLASRADSADRREKLRVGTKKAAAERVAQHRADADSVRRHVRRIRKELSVVRGSAASGAVLLQEGESPTTAMRKVAESATTAITAGVTQRGHVTITEATAKRLRLKNRAGSWRTAISADTIDKLLARSDASGPKPVAMTRQTPLERLCLEDELPADGCRSVLARSRGQDHTAGAGSSGTAVAAPGHGTVGTAAAAGGSDGTKRGKPKEQVRRLVAPIMPPEGPAPDARATPETMAAEMSGWALTGGPADVPAYHDFHTLQVAFEHVWQEAFDQELLDLAENLYAEVVELGGNPTAPQPGGSGSTLDNLRVEGRTVVFVSPGPPPVALRTFDTSPELWEVLTIQEQAELERLATEIERFQASLADVQARASGPVDSGWGERIALAGQIAAARASGEHLLHYARAKLHRDPRGMSRLHSLLAELETRRKEQHAFTVYAAGRKGRSVNFGLLVTHRQLWEPLTYQVGRLARTETLAPKESRKFTRRLTVKLNRAEKEVVNNLRTRRDEVSSTSRAEAEILQRAETKTNFSLTAQGGYNAAAWSAQGSTSYSRDAAVSSQEAKKDFREAVLKSAEEYRKEHVVEVSTGTTTEVGFEESGELVNPNDEIPVTYLFYELQRRYRVSERLHRLAPVVLVAQEVPAPHEIDDDWLVSHDWILRRVLLDDSFQPALGYLSDGLVGDEFALREQFENVEQQRRLVESVRQGLVSVRSQLGRRYAALERSIERRAEAVEAEDSEGLLGKAAEFFTGDSDESEESARIREEAARDAYERAARQERDSLARLEREVTALQSLSDAYTAALAQHLNRKTQVARLRVHVKANILYYMQAIWSHEPPDQRFFRLHKTLVPVLDGGRTYDLVPNNSLPPAPPTWKKPLELVAHCTFPQPLHYQSLAEIADLDNLLGYKGNYMIFPLRSPNDLTDFMMTPYLDADGTVHDPDEPGNWTLEEFDAYVCCLKEKLDAAEFKKVLPGLRTYYAYLMSSRRRLSDTVVVPSGSLYIEALPGTHPVLENFKLRHRAVDVLKVQAEARDAELENLRVAQRILDGNLEDPDTEKVVWRLAPRDAGGTGTDTE